MTEPQQHPQSEWGEELAWDLQESSCSTQRETAEPPGQGWGRQQALEDKGALWSTVNGGFTSDLSSGHWCHAGSGLQQNFGTRFRPNHSPPKTQLLHAAAGLL